MEIGLLFQLLKGLCYPISAVVKLWMRKTKTEKQSAKNKKRVKRNNSVKVYQRKRKLMSQI